MDELFLMPSSLVAMPRAYCVTVQKGRPCVHLGIQGIYAVTYWLDQPFLSSQLVLVEPSSTEWHRIQEFMKHDVSPGHLAWSRGLSTSQSAHHFMYINLRHRPLGHQNTTTQHNTTYIIYQSPFCLHVAIHSIKEKRRFEYDVTCDDDGVLGR